MLPLTRAGACSPTARLARMFPVTLPSTMMTPTSISALTIAPSPTTSTSSEKISPESLPSIRTVPSNVSLPSNSDPRPSSVVISPCGRSLCAGSAMVFQAYPPLFGLFKRDRQRQSALSAPRGGLVRDLVAAQAQLDLDVVVGRQIT